MQSQSARRLSGISPFLHESGAAVATRFTFGKGTTGMDRDLYCAGWFIVGDMLASGRTFPQLARIPEKAMVPEVARAINVYLRGASHHSFAPPGRRDAP